MHPRTRRVGSAWSIATLVAVFPANLHMAIEWERYEKGIPGGRNALYARLPVQAAFIAWAYAPATGTSRRRRPQGRLRAAPIATSARSSTMVLKRVIPCLDVDDGRVVKGINFVDLRDAGDPVELAARYDARGRRRAGLPRHHRLAREPRHDRRPGRGAPPRRCSSRSRSAAASARSRTPGGCSRRRRQGLASTRAALARPELISELAERVRRPVRGGRDRRQAPRDADAGGPVWEVVTSHGGRSRPRAATPSSWARRPPSAGAGEILLTSMDRDGTERRLRPGADPRGRRRRRGPGDRLRRRRQLDHLAEAIADGRRRRGARAPRSSTTAAHDRRGQGGAMAAAGVDVRLR